MGAHGPTSGRRFFFLKWNIGLKLSKSEPSRELPAQQNTRTKCEICSELTKTSERRHWRFSDVFIVNFEHISHLALVFLLLPLKK